MDMWRLLGHRYGEAMTRMRLGDALLASGAVDAARDSWRGALTAMESVAPAETEQIRARLEPAA